MLSAISNRLAHVNAFEFVVIAALRAQQLRAGCTARVTGDHNTSTLAQLEVAGGFVVRADELPAEQPPRQCLWQL